MSTEPKWGNIYRKYSHQNDGYPLIAERKLWHIKGMHTQADMHKTAERRSPCRSWSRARLRRCGAQSRHSRSGPGPGSDLAHPHTRPIHSCDSMRQDEKEIHTRMESNLAFCFLSLKSIHAAMRSIVADLRRHLCAVSMTTSQHGDLKHSWGAASSKALARSTGAKDGQRRTGSSRWPAGSW